MKTITYRIPAGKQQTVLPNFMIVGAAKCGTSSLYQYLTQHPEVFMSKVKEPRFITSQFMPFPLNGPGDDKVEAWYVKQYEAYVQLFAEAKGYAVVGEASADNLYFYKDAIPHIKAYIGNPKIIVLLRDPVRRAFSAYQHLRRDHRETLSFEDGLAQESIRMNNNWELIYFYQAVGLYYQQVKAYLENFDQVKVILNEDLQQHPQEALQDILDFLEVDNTFGFDLSLKHNISGVPKSRWLHNMLGNEASLRQLVRPIARKLFDEKTREQIFHKINQVNLSKLDPAQEKPVIDLKEVFREDVAKLSQLIDRDLSIWKLSL